MIKKILILFIGLICLSPAGFAAGWYTDTTNQTLVWPYRQQVTISGASVEATLTNFPILVKITNTTNKVFSNAQSTGNDILFTSSDGATKLNHEIEWFATGTNASMCAWVNIPTLTAATNTIIYMYYGSTTAPTQENKTAVWDSNYKGVWHMNNNPSNHAVGAIKDSTSNNNHGTTEASMMATDEVVGQIGAGIHFDGSNDFITVPMSLMQSTPECIEVWFNAVTNEARHMVWAGQVSGNGWGTNPEFHVSTGTYHGAAVSGYLSAYCGDANNRQENDGTYTGNPLFMYQPFNTINSYHYFVFSTTGTLGSWYLDGELISSDASAAINKVTNWTAGTFFGRSGAGPRCFWGNMDEIRISFSTRSPEWIRTEYRNQGSPSSFCTFSAEEYRPSATLISKHIDDPRKNMRAYVPRHNALLKPPFL